MDAIESDLNELKGIMNQLSEQDRDQYFEQFSKISSMAQNLKNSILEINEKCAKQKTAYDSWIAEIDQSIQLLLNEKEQIRQNSNDVEKTMAECKNKSFLCTNIVNNQLKLSKSAEFKEKLNKFEKEWSKWNHEQILVWFKTMLAISNSMNTSKRNISSANIDDEDEKVQQRDEIDGQVVATQGGDSAGDLDLDNINENDKYSKSHLSPQELQQRLDKFDHFLKIIKSKGFFKNHKEGSEEFLQLLDKARKRWNQRFAHFKLDSLDLITNRANDNTNNETRESEKGKDVDDINNIDWPLISSNLKRLEWDGDHLLICKEKQLIKLGFNNENIRKHLLVNVKRITKKYPSKKGKNENGVCCICLSNKTNTICIPCGHACMCKKCGNGYDKNDGCPICRKNIQNVFDMFIS